MDIRYLNSMNNNPIPHIASCLATLAIVAQQATAARRQALIDDRAAEWAADYRKRSAMLTGAKQDARLLFAARAAELHRLRG